MNFRDVDLNLLLVMHAMLLDQNVTAAAKRLNVSQPTVSTSLKKLREIFSDELFVRSSGGMQPTPKAIDMSGPLERLVQIMKDEIFGAHDFNPATSIRTFTINTTDVGEMIFIPPILRRLREFAPHASVNCVCYDPADIIQAMAHGAVDLAIGYLPQLQSNSIYVQSLFEHPFVCLVREDHPVFAEKMTLEAYSAAQHIELVGEGHDQKKFEAMIEKSGVQRRIGFRSQHFTNIPFIVRDSDLVATVPKVIAATFAHLPGVKAVFPPFPIPSIPIKQYWHQKMNNDTSQRWLRHAVSGIFLNKDPTASFLIRPD